MPRSSATALAALFLPAGAALVWLLPLVRETASHSPSKGELERALTKYGQELDVGSLHHYALRPEVISRGGAVAVAGLALVPLAAFAARQRWAAFVLGGTLAVLGIELLPWVFPHFADAVSVSQARRLAGFVPISFALAGGTAVLTAMVGPLVLPAALAAGIALQLAFPGDFGPGLEEGGPALATWIAAAGGVAAIVVGLRRERRIEARTWIVTAAIVLFCIPVAVHGFREWSAAASVDRYAPTPGLLHVLRTKVPERAVVFSDLETSYRIGAYAPVYIVAAPPAHVADTASNHPYRRRLCRHPLLPLRRGLDPRSVPRRLAGRGQASFPRPSPVAARLRGPDLRALPSSIVKVLLVTMYFPPSGGGGVQRPLKFATHLPAHGIETHVLAPDDAKWIHSDPDLVPPTQAWIHRARYLGPRSRKLADELHGRQGLDRLSRQARSLSRRVLVPDENVGWNLTAIPAAVRIARAEGIDVVITTSPPNSVHLIGAAVKRITGARWVADLRDSVGLIRTGESSGPRYGPRRR